VGKNLQFMANTLVASFIGFPGRLAASQMSWVEVINFLCFVTNVFDIKFECLFPAILEVWLMLVSKTWVLTIGDSFYPTLLGYQGLPGTYLPTVLVMKQRGFITLTPGWCLSRPTCKARRG